MSRQILIIDDDRSVRESLKRVLQDTGYAVKLAADAPQGVAALQQQPFALLILDLHLPHGSGFDLLTLAAEEFASLPVIVLTGLLGQCEPGCLVGADAALEKPPDVGLLLHTMERLLNEPAEERSRRLVAPRATLPWKPLARTLCPPQWLGPPGGSRPSSSF